MRTPKQALEDSLFSDTDYPFEITAVRSWDDAS